MRLTCSLLLHFPNKEELLREVVRTSIVAYIARAQPFLESERVCGVLERGMDAGLPSPA